MAKIERYNKQDLVKYCKSIGIETHKKSKSTLLKEVKKYHKNEIKVAIEKGNANQLLFFEKRTPQNG